LPPSGRRSQDRFLEKAFEISFLNVVEHKGKSCGISTLKNINGFFGDPLPQNGFLCYQVFPKMLPKSPESPATDQDLYLGHHQ
jgi:hypothetical protein